MPSSGRLSPLPSYTPPRRQPKPSLLSSITEASFLPYPRSNTSPSSKNGKSTSSAVVEKVALAFGGGGISGGRRGHSYGSSSGGYAGNAWRKWRELFVGLKIPIGSGGGKGRVITIPVFKSLYPTMESRGNGLRKDGRVNHAHTSSAGSSGTHTLRKAITALLGTLVILLTSILLLLALIRPLLPSHRYIPFQGEADTLIFSPEEIERIWLWEIASGRYPSARKIDYDFSKSLKRGMGLGGAGVGTGTVGAGLGGVLIENPGLPKRTDEELMREREVQAEVLRRLRNQGAEKGILAGEALGTSSFTGATKILPVGASRQYLDIGGDVGSTSSSPISIGKQSSVTHLSPYPPRPIPNSAIDMDIVMEHCDFAESKYVRDCLEVLRMNGGLDMGLRRGIASPWRGTWVDGAVTSSAAASGGSTASGAEAKVPITSRTISNLHQQEKNMTSLLESSTFSTLLNTRQQLTLFPPSVHSYVPHASHPTADKSCDPDNPRLFHIFWAGPFTDKPYSAAMSFLYTQRLSLHLPIDSPPDPTICRPQLWIWINPGPASSLPDPRARERMLEELNKNPWSSPLLDRRFQEAIKFRLWNTTEQLDGVQEMEGWREMRLFNSGGIKYGDAKPKSSKGSNVSKDEDLPAPIIIEEVLEESDTSEDLIAEAEAGRLGDVADELNAVAKDPTKWDGTGEPPVANTTAVPVVAPKVVDELFERVGSTSSNGYDRLSVVLSDMARFVLTHRFGGVYLDADTIFLRDWEEIWGWKGAFAYRWSRLEKYNTAVLKMQRGSALGNFIFRSAVANGLDFHPMTISRYTKDAKVEELLLRLPDALFDSAWLNTEYYQRDRPPFPYFKQFEDFFETPKDSNAAPLAVGFDGFFKGAFSYHFHNGWWIPFDATRNFPDLGPRFIAGERTARGRLLAAKLAALPPPIPIPSPDSSGGKSLKPSPTKPEDPQLSTSIPLIPGVGGSDEKTKWGDNESVDFATLDWSLETVEDDVPRDLSWSAVLKRTFEQFVRGEKPNMYGEWLEWDVQEELED